MLPTMRLILLLTGIVTHSCHRTCYVAANWCSWIDESACFARLSSLVPVDVRINNKNRVICFKVSVDDLITSYCSSRFTTPPTFDIYVRLGVHTFSMEHCKNKYILHPKTSRNAWRTRLTPSIFRARRKFAKHLHVSTHVDTFYAHMQEVQRHPATTLLN